MRRWLLACVGILLVADGYWTSQNLVLKSADDGIYWFATRHGFSVYVRDRTDEKYLPSAKMEKFEVSWVDGRWTNNDQPITDIRNFIRYESGFSCVLTYSVKSVPTVKAVIQSIEAAFSAGVGSVLIVEPRPERDGKFEDSVPLFEREGQSIERCPYADDWDRVLDKYESAYGFPPELKSSKTPN